MTETQAKSGAGASTDADEPSVEAPATTGTAAPEAATAPSSATDTEATPKGGPGATPVIVRSQTPMPTIVSTTTAGPAEAVGSMRPTGPEKAEAASADGVKPAEKTRGDGGKADDAKPEPASRPGEPVRGSSAVPLVAVPATSAPAGPIAGPAGRAPTVPDGRAKGVPKIGSGTATGTASVVTPNDPSSPVIARASVVSPNAPVTSVTGTGLRQTTGATSFVGSVVTPTRPGATQGTVRVPETARPGRAGAAGASRGPRRARLHLKRIDPWSVMKFSFAVSFVLFVVAIVATAVLYLALDAMHVWTSLNGALSEVTGQAGSPNDSFRITAKGVIGTALLLGAVNMVLFTALMTLGAFVYNVCADLVGGIELTLSEKE